MAEQENVRIEREPWDAWNAHDPERYVKLLDEKWVAESDTIPAPVRGRDRAREFRLDLRPRRTNSMMTIVTHVHLQHARAGTSGSTREPSQ
jgi:hypothetical protein